VKKEAPKNEARGLIPQGKAMGKARGKAMGKAIGKV
jgi:hypothetical protein